MKLLKEQELIWSPIVANNRMNRERNAIGINSYEKDIGFEPLSFLKQRLKLEEKVNWMDLCCGKGNALKQIAGLFESEMDTAKLSIEGLDLVPPMTNEPLIQVGSIHNWKPQKQYDLITCVHGLHYVGDKLSAIQKAVNQLKPEGIFIANIDLDTLKNRTNDSWKKYLLEIFNEANIQYRLKKKIISCKGPRVFKHALIYQGANDQAGPNYTGQPAVDSIYE